MEYTVFYTKTGPGTAIIDAESPDQAKEKFMGAVHAGADTYNITCIASDDLRIYRPDPRGHLVEVPPHG